MIHRSIPLSNGTVDKIIQSEEYIEQSDVYTFHEILSDRQVPLEIIWLFTGIPTSVTVLYFR